MSTSTLVRILVTSALAAAVGLSTNAARADPWPEPIMTGCGPRDLTFGCALQPTPAPLASLSPSARDELASRAIGEEMRAIPERAEYASRVALKRAADQVEARKVFPAATYPELKVLSARPLRVVELHFAADSMPVVPRDANEVVFVRGLAKTMGFPVDIDTSLRQRPFANGALCLGCRAGIVRFPRQDTIDSLHHTYIEPTPRIERRPPTTAANAARALATMRKIRPPEPGEVPEDDPPRLVVFRTEDGSGRLAWAVPYTAGLICAATREASGYHERLSEIVYALDVDNLSIIAILSSLDYYDEVDRDAKSRLRKPATPRK